MSSTIGAIGQYQLTLQQVQMKLMKNTMDMQQQAVEILLSPDNRSVAPSETLGQNINISV